MPKTRNITSANSSVSILSTNGITDFEGYTAEDIFSVDSVNFTETRIGVDGKMSAGWIPQIKTVTFNFEASSNTIQSLLNLYTIAEATRTPVFVTMTVIIPAVNKKFICEGVMTEAKPMYDAGKTLKEMPFKFAFESIIPMQI